MLNQVSLKTEVILNMADYVTVDCVFSDKENAKRYGYACRKAVADTLEPGMPVLTTSGKAVRVNAVLVAEVHDEFLGHPDDGIDYQFIIYKLDNLSAEIDEMNKDMAENVDSLYASYAHKDSQLPEMPPWRDDEDAPRRVAK